MLTLGLHSRGKLNLLQRSLPEGLVVDSAWLERHGYSRGLRSKYVASGWLDQVARGAYRRPSARLATVAEEGLRWEAVVVSLQTLLGRPFSVGGRTALELQGFGHYLATSGPREIHLYGAGSPPGWVHKLGLPQRFVFHNSKRLFREEAGIPEDACRTTAAPLPESLLRRPAAQSQWPLIMSAAERAVLELLDEVPRHETFHQADMLMEGLSTLSPRRLHRLLADCRSVKVKRLFFWFAERHEHAWLGRLGRDGIDLGRGKRMLVRGGKLDTKYGITVPPDLHAGK